MYSDFDSTVAPLPLTAIASAAGNLPCTTAVGMRTSRAWPSWGTVMHHDCMQGTTGHRARAGPCRKLQILGVPDW